MLTTSLVLANRKDALGLRLHLNYAYLVNTCYCDELPSTRILCIMMRIEALHCYRGRHWRSHFKFRHSEVKGLLLRKRDFLCYINGVDFA